MRQFWSLLGCISVVVACQTTPSQPATPNESAELADAALPRFSARSYGSFVDLCKNPNASAGVKLTVGQLKNEIAIEDCQEAWKQLQTLEQLDLTGLQLTDITPLAGFIQLRVLRLGNNLIEDIGPLAKLSKLEILQLNDNRLQDLAPLTALDQLKVLDLANNSGLKHLGALRPLTGLRELYLSNNALQSAAALADLRELKVLDLGHNRVGSLKPLQNLTKLEWLDLSENGITDVTPLQFAKSLWYLSLASNQIEAIDIIGGLNLRELYLQSNHISSLKPLLHQRNLQGLAAHDNPIDRSACPRGGDVASALDEFCSH